MIICVYLNPTIDKTIYLNEFKIGGTNRPEKILLDGAGKAINVAVVLKTLDENPLVLGLLCKDNGRIIKERLNNNHIKYDFIEIEGKCRLNTKIFDNKTKEITEINETGIVVDSNIIDRIKNKLFDVAKKDDIVILTGSLPPGCKKNTYAQMIAELNKKGVKCVLDADGEVLIEGVAQKPYFIKPNIDELKVLTGIDIKSNAQIYDAAMNLIDDGIHMVGVSMGKDGAFLFDKENAYFAEPLNLDVKSTVGAGDSMVAGIVANLKSSKDIALRSGCAAASASVTMEGTKLATKKLYKEMFDVLKVREYKKNNRVSKGL